MHVTEDTQFYAVCIKPYNEGTSRWSVYYRTDGKLAKLWPIDCQNHKKAKQNGWTHTRSHAYPAYHFFINEIGTSHKYLLQKAVLCVLQKEHSVSIGFDANDIKLEVLW